MGAAARRRRIVTGAASGKERHNDAQSPEQNGGDEDNISLEDLTDAVESECSPDVDMELAEGQLTEQLAAVLGPEAGQELVAALREANTDGDEEDVFGAFWRSVLSSPFAHPAIEGQPAWSPKNSIASPKAVPATFPAIMEENGRGRSDVT